MNRIIQILIKNHVFLLFIILEFISFQLLIANNFVVESGFFQKMTEIRSSIFLKEQSIKDYFFLKQQNAELLKEKHADLEIIEWGDDEYMQHIK